MKGSRNTVRIGMALVSCGVATGVLFSATAQAQSVEAFYKNKQMTMIIPSGEGGGYDAYSRLLARHINRHIPGKPRIITQNMPGASGLRGTNYLYVVAPRDGKTFGATYNTLITEPLLGNVRAKFDPLKFNWIGSTANQYNACMVWHTSSIKSIEDAKKREIKVSTTGMSGNSAKTPLMVNRLLGTKFKVISGYKTTGMRLAVERGEVEGICGLSYDTYVAANPEWLEKKKIRFILQAGTKGVTPLAGVPLLMDSVTDPKQRQALAVLGVKDDVGRPYLFPPGVPDHLVNAARRAFDATMKDPLFKADAGRMRINTAPMNGESIQKAIAAAYAAPKDVVAIAAKLWPPAVKKKKKKKKN